jgi:hypothetical protein
MLFYFCHSAERQQQNPLYPPRKKRRCHRMAKFMDKNDKKQQTKLLKMGSQYRHAADQP